MFIILLNFLVKESIKVFIEILYSFLEIENSYLIYFLKYCLISQLNLISFSSTKIK